jgi:hypothetical protein
LLAFNLCDNCEEMARRERIEAQQAFLDQIEARAWTIFTTEVARGSNPEWQFTLAQAVHEKYVELGLDKANAAYQQARKEMFGDPNPKVCSKYERNFPLVVNQPPMVNNASRMSAH